MASRYNRKVQNYSGRKKHNYLDNVLFSSNLVYLKKNLKLHESNIVILDENLVKIKNITDSEAENYILRIKQLFQKMNSCRPLPRKPIKPDHGFLKSVFMKWEKDMDDDKYRTENITYESSLKNLEKLLGEIVIDLDNLREELTNKYGTAPWSRDLPTMTCANAEIRLKKYYINISKFFISHNVTHSIQLINSPSDLREYLSKINMCATTRTIVKNISNRINQVESLPKNLTDAKSKAIVARDEGKSRILARSVKNELDITQNCPYCEYVIGIDYHADHIIPVSYGGHSIRQNMVNVCAKCNIKKGADTLLNFCQKNGYDFIIIAKRLQSMGKRV